MTSSARPHPLLRHSTHPPRRRYSRPLQCCELPQVVARRQLAYVEPEPEQRPARLVVLPAAIVELAAEGESQWQDLGAIGLHCRVSAAATIASTAFSKQLLVIELNMA